MLHIGKQAVIWVFACLALLAQPAACIGRCTIDLGFVVDGSSSITTAVFLNEMLPFMQSVVGKLPINGQVQSRVASVIFGRQARINFNFKDYNTKQDIIDAIGNIKYPRESTNTAAGLNLARTDVFTPAIQERPTVRKVCLLLTDGAPWTNDTTDSQIRKLTTAAADDVKAEGVTLVAVGIAIDKQKDEDYLKTLASSETLYSAVPDFSQLDAYLDIIMENVCEQKCGALPEDFPNNLMPSGRPDSCNPLQVLGIPSQCFVTCVPGYTAINGTNTFICNDEGLLVFPTLECRPDDCDIPDNLGTNIIGTVVDGCTAGSNLPSGTNCTVQCAAGFEPTTPEMTIIYSCSLGNITVKPTLTCKPAPCKLPGVFPQPSTPGTCVSGGNLTSGSSCSLTCPPNHDVVGNGTYTCVNGSLTVLPDNVICRPWPCNVTYGASELSNRCPPSVMASGFNCTTTCAPGYEATQTPLTYKCEAGNLTRPTGQCVPRNCTLPPMLPPIATGACGAVLPSGQSCSVTCLPGFKPEGDPTFTCTLGDLVDDPTTAGAFQCIPEICDVTLPNNTIGARPIPCVEGGILGSNKTCTVQCGTEFEVGGGSGVIACVNGNLSYPGGELQCLPKNCTYPEPSIFGLVPRPGSLTACNASGGILQAGASCELSCGTDTVEGSSANANLTCVNGSIVITGIANCTPQVCSIVLPPNVISDCPAQLPGNGSSCLVECAAGFHLDDENANTVFTCSFGSLVSVPDPNLCVPDACELPVITEDEGTCAGKDELLSGENCTVTCRPGFTVSSGSGLVSCKEGVITYDLVTCTPNNCTVPGVDNALGCPPILPGNGSSCTLTCQPGFIPGPGSDDSSFTVTCNAGDLVNFPAPDQFSCKRMCWFYACPAGYYRNSTAFALSCSGPDCTATCCAPERNCRNISSIPPCSAAGLVPVTGPQQTVNCTTDDDCLRKCCSKDADPVPFACEVPPLPDNVIGGENCREGAFVAPGESCTFECAPGYQPLRRGVVTTTITCDGGGNGTFDAAANLRCVPVACVAPVVPNTISNCTGFSVIDTSCQLECSPGYEPSKPNPIDTFFCINGILTPITLECIPSIDKCTTLPNGIDFPAEIILDKCPNGTLVGQSCPITIQCPAGSTSTIVNMPCRQPDPTVVPGYVWTTSPTCVAVPRPPPPPPPKPCSQFSVRSRVCLRGRGWSLRAICPRGARDCAASCCQPFCTALGLWYPLKIRTRRFSFIYYAIKTGPQGLPYCYSTNRRTCTMFTSPAAIANLPVFMQGLRPVMCTRAHCKSAGNWCQLADLFC